MTEKNVILTYFNVSSDFYLFQITFEQNIYDWEEIPLDLGDPFIWACLLYVLIFQFLKQGIPSVLGIAGFE